MAPTDWIRPRAANEKLTKGNHMKRTNIQKAIAMAACSVLLAAGLARGGEPTVKSMPPSVVRTLPEAGAVDVDAAATTQIKVTFSKDMKDGAWSWSQVAKDTFPEIVGKPKYLEDKRTCVIDVKLEPKKTYVIWINSQKFANFKDADGNPAVPYLLVFQTK